jgi:hypothetical protein
MELIARKLTRLYLGDYRTYQTAIASAEPNG